MYKVKRFSYLGQFEYSSEEERSKNKKNRSGKSLQDSHRGLGRSLLVGGIGGSLGSYMTKNDVDEDYENGYNEHEIINRAGKKGAKYGALGGGLIGAASGALNPGFTGKQKLALSAISGLGSAALGAVGGSLGARKNAKDRLDKPKLIRG